MFTVLCARERYSHLCACLYYHNKVLATSTDLYIYTLHTVPPIHVARDHVATDKLTTANGEMFSSSSASLSSQSRSSTSILIERSVTWLATESGWPRSNCSTICSGKLCWSFIIFRQCCPCGYIYTSQGLTTSELGYINLWQLMSTLMLTLLYNALCRIVDASNALHVPSRLQHTVTVIFSLHMHR